MVLLHQVVQVLAGADLHPPREVRRLHLSRCPVRGRISVQRDLRGRASFLHRTAEKRFGGVYVPVPAEKEIDGLAPFVDGAVQVLWRSDSCPSWVASVDFIDDRVIRAS